MEFNGLIPSVSKTSNRSSRRRKTKFSHLETGEQDGEHDDLQPNENITLSSHNNVSREDLSRRHLTRKRLKAKHCESDTLGKLLDIELALKCDPVDVTTLRQLAITRGGLVNDEVRCKVWPQLLSVNVYETSPRPVISEIESYRDYNQVVLDVNRCLRRFPPGIDEEVRLGLQEQLIFLIVRILMKHEELHYYQGFHDICITFLLAVGEEMSFALLEQLSVAHLKDFMDATMEKTVHMLNYLYPIIGRESPKVREHMEEAGVGTIFCLSWLITWFGHVLNDYRHIVRLYDFFLANDPLMPIYLAAAVVLHRETDVLEANCDMASLHSLLSKVPEDLPFEDLISKTGDLFLHYPPDELAAEVQELNELGVMRLHDPDRRSGARAMRNGISVRSKSSTGTIATCNGARSAWSSNRLLLVLAPPWFREQRTIFQVVLCTAVATGATVLYSYLAHGDVTAFLSMR